MKTTGLDRFATSGFVRFLAVTTWLVITTMAFVSRYDRMTSVLAVLMAVFILLLAGFGFCWAAFPGAKKRSHRA